MTEPDVNTGAIVLEEPKFPIMEIFGPTLQGEGLLVGVPTYFIRTGYCDYRCVWCDTKYAVNPEEVRQNKEMLTSYEIMDRLSTLAPGPRWVTISGGNPAIHDLSPLITELRRGDYSIQVETQGSYWREWLREVDVLTISPKAPSSGMNPDRKMLRQIINGAMVHPKWPWTITGVHPTIVLKVVIFDDRDYEFAAALFEEYRPWGLGQFLSVGTDPGKSTRDELLDKLRWLSDKMKVDPRMADAHALPQMHVLIWGHGAGI